MYEDIRVSYSEVVPVNLSIPVGFIGIEMNDERRNATESDGKR